jgi:uncharacterized membrane protein YheB (UPF0754 family)
LKSDGKNKEKHGSFKIHFELAALIAYFAAPKRFLMPFMQYILPLLLSAFTGWFVIWLTIKMLFRPHKPFSVAGFKIQGALPANQQLIAEKIGKLVSAEFSFDNLQQKVTDPENFNKLKPEIEKHIDSFLRERLKVTFPMLSMLIGDKTITQLKTAFLTELETLFPALMKSYVANLEKEFDIEKMVSEKIAGFSISKTEDLIYTSAKKQLFKVQLLGAIIGLLTGLIHIFINTQLFN